MAVAAAESTDNRVWWSRRPAEPQGTVVDEERPQAYSAHMPEFLIERVMPGVASLDVADLKRTSRLGMAMLREEFPSIQWLHSYATKDILYCVYRAPDEEVIRHYASRSRSRSIEFPRSTQRSIPRPWKTRLARSGVSS
jgi:hypothetical protein